MNRTQPMARIRASDLSALVGEALCKPHLDAMEVYLRKVSYFNAEAKKALGVGDFEGANRAAGQSIDASKHYDYERFLADRCRRGEPESSAPSYYEWIRPRPKPRAIQTRVILDAEPGAWGDWGRAAEAARPPMPWRGVPFQSTPSTFPVSPGLPVGAQVQVPTGSGYAMSEMGSADDYGQTVSIPMARQALEAAVQLHRQRPTAQTKRRVAYLEGLLDDYMKDWEDFRARHQPPPVRRETGPGQDILRQPPKLPSPTQSVCPDPAKAPAKVPPAPEMPKTPDALLPKMVDTWVLQSDGPFQYDTEERLNKAYKDYQKEAKNRKSSALKDRFAKYQFALEDYLEEAPLRAELESLAQDQIQAMVDLASTSGKIQASIKKKVEERGAEMERLWPGWYKAKLDWDIYQITGGQPDWYRELKGAAATLLDLALQLAPLLPYAKGAASQARYRCPGLTARPLPVLPRSVPVPPPMKPEPFPSIPAAPTVSSEDVWRAYNRPVLQPARIPQPAGLPTMAPSQKIPIQDIYGGQRPGELQFKPAITAPPSTMLPPFRPLVPTVAPTPSPTEFVPGSDVQKFRITPQGPVPVPMTEHAPAPTSQVPQCPPGQFWDGRQCRGSVTSLPSLPGSLPTGAVPFTMSGFPFHRKALG